MAKEIINKQLGAGIFTIPYDAEQIPKQAAQDSIGWISNDGQIELCKGRLLVGAEETTSGSLKGEGWGFTVTGTKVHFRKINTKIQYYNTATSLWVDIVTGLTASAEYTFSPYQSLAGTFVYATGADGIYKIHTANPASYTAMYASAKNYKGLSMITQSRMSMWNVKGALTTHYLSYTDSAQDSTVYTQIAAEVLGSGDGAELDFSGTAAFKAAGALRTCFSFQVTVTGGETLTDNYDGTLTGSNGATGTINYTTGAWTLTFTTAPANSADNIKATYSWENTNEKGLTDFTFSGTRTALQGDVVRQDEGGDAIQNIVFHNGSYYSLKSNSAYELTIADNGLTFSNRVFRKNIGLQYWRSIVVTGKGIMFMDTANLDQPQLTILQPNLQGDNLEPFILAKQFDFSDYTWDMCAMETFGESIVFSGRTSDSAINNKLFLFNVRRGTIDILPYGAKTITTSAGHLYIGDVFSDNSYEILSEWDDDGDVIENYWISNDEKYGSEMLKKVKRLRLKGLITIDQVLEVYASYDNGAYELVGSIRGDGSYVDTAETYTIGSQGIGTSVIGGETDTIQGSFYLAELKLKTPKFRKRTLKLKATGQGYVSVNMIDDFDIRLFAQKLPSKYRTRQDVSTDGLTTDI